MDSAYLYILLPTDRTTSAPRSSASTSASPNISRAYSAAIHLPGAPCGWCSISIFVRLDDAAAAERQVKGWRREKKEALIHGDFALLPALARRGVKVGAILDASFETRPMAAPQDDGSSLDGLHKPPSS
jgi:hypothetical protein